MVYSEVPNFSEANPELLSQANQQGKTVSQVFFVLMEIEKHCLLRHHTEMPIICMSKFTCCGEITLSWFAFNLALKQRLYIVTRIM